MSKQILISLRRIIQNIDLHSRNLHRNYGLTGPQIILLGELVNSPHLSIGALANRISLRHATVTEMLNRLEKKGLVYRQRSETDKRRIELGITDLGIRTLQEAPPPLQDRFIEELEKLQDWEQTSILSTLQRIVSMMEIEAADTAPLLASNALLEAEETDTSIQGAGRESLATNYEES